MSAIVGIETADAAAGNVAPTLPNVAPTLPMRKRKKTDEEPVPGTTPEPEMKLFKEEWQPETVPTAPPATTDSLSSDDDDAKPVKRGPMSKAREIRLEQNRKAAKESRRRKKVMIEELQRSVIFFSRANSTLKQQNDELSRVLMQAQAQVSALEGGQQQKQEKPPQQQVEQQQGSGISAPVKAENDQQAIQQAQAQAVATQAMYETQGFPTAAARAAAQTMNAGPAPATSYGAVAPAPAPIASQQQLPPMQPGATMQAMANFQQAAAAAMQVAMQGMQGIAGMGLVPVAAPPNAQAQQAYQETMAAFAMQQAAAAAAGQQFAVMGMPPGTQFMHPMSWPTMPQQQQQQPQQQPQQATNDPAPTENAGDQPV